MNRESLLDYYNTVLTPALEPFEGKRRLLFPLVFIQSFLAILVFITIVANVFNGFLESEISGFFQIAVIAFLLLFMTMLGYSILKAYRIFFPALFSNKKLLIFISVVLAVLLFQCIRFLKDTPVVFMRLDFRKPVEFEAFFGMFGAFLALFSFTLIVLVPLSLLKAKLNSQFTNEFRPLVTKHLISFINPDFSYNPEKGVPKEEIIQSGLFYDMPENIYDSFDQIEGEIEKRRFVFSNIIITTQHNSKSRSDTREMFSGILLKTSFMKSFSGRTVIKTDFAENILGRLGRGVQKLSFDGTQLVQTENPQFEKYFVVRSTDQTEARYLLTPSLLERLIESRKSYEREIEISFSSSNLYIAIALENDLIAPSYWGPMIPFRKVEEYSSGLDQILQLIKGLNQNERIWSGYQP